MKKIIIASLLFTLTIVASERMVTPTERVALASFPESFVDDMDFTNLELAISRQLEAFERKPLTGKLVIGDRSMNMSVLKTSLEKFQQLVQVTSQCLKDEERSLCYEKFTKQIKKKFFLYRPVFGRAEKSVKFTSYHSPLLKATQTPEEGFAVPILAQPEESADQKLTFSEIVFEKKLEGKGLELYYINNLFDLYLLQIEGGGVIELPTGEKHYISFAGQNGYRVKFLGAYLKEQNLLAEPTIANQREFFKLHPDLEEKIFSLNPSYIYFKRTDTPPLGMENIPLTDGRSMAQDRNYYSRKGLLGFVVASKVVKDSEGNTNSVPFSRFFLDQDTGGRIIGKARADLYWGIDQAAVADNLDTEGELYYLIARP